MRKIAEVLRLKWQEGRSAREIAASVGIGRTTVGEYLTRAAAAGLTWPLPADLEAAAIERRLFPAPLGADARGRVEPDWEQVHRELRRPGVTLALLWQEYQERQPDGYQYSQFCARYAAWRGRLDVVMRQSHRAGEKLFVDYAGQTVTVLDPAGGGERTAQVFVAVLGASSYTYAEATWTQQLPDWIGAQVRAPPHLHISVDGHSYSVPCALVKRRLDVRVTAGMVEVFHHGQRVACHVRSHQRDGYTTVREHLPEGHRQSLDWTPARLLDWAAATGTHTAGVIAHLLKSRSHALQALQSGLGIVRLGQTYGAARLEAACARALASGAISYRSLASILEHGLDRQPLDPAPAPLPVIDHPNLRGPRYFH